MNFVISTLIKIQSLPGVRRRIYFGEQNSMSCHLMNCFINETNWLCLMVSVQFSTEAILIHNSKIIE